MKTVDQLLTTIVNLHTEDIKQNVSTKDSRILFSLYKSVNNTLFITENQSKLLVKILKENKKMLSKLDDEFSDVIENPTWSQDFRPQDTTKKIYTSKDINDVDIIIIEFAFSTVIRKKLLTLGKKVSGLTQTKNGRCFLADLTENNIVQLIDDLSEFNFDVEEKLKNFHEIIKSWDKKSVADQFLLTNISHDNFQKQITADLGIDTAIDQNIIFDRSMRYQYFVENFEKNPENLTEKIALRKSTKIWIDKNSHSLEEVFKSLIDLKRLPVMFVFESYDAKTCAADLTKISEILEKNGIFDNVGIYFRMSNDDNGKIFNALVAEKKYNSELSSKTKVVGVQNGKIPKFFLKNDWKPMSVISLNNSLRHSKTAIYANCCDLIISYTDREPIYEPRTVWE